MTPELNYHLERAAPAYNAAKTLLTLIQGSCSRYTGSIENNAAECFEDLTTGDDTLPDIEIKSTTHGWLFIPVEYKHAKRRFGPTCIILVQLFVMLRLPQPKTTSIC